MAALGGKFLSDSNVICMNKKIIMKGQFAVRLKQVLTQIAKEDGFTIIAQKVRFLANCPTQGGAPVRPSTA